VRRLAFLVALRNFSPTFDALQPGNLLTSTNYILSINQTNTLQCCSSSPASVVELTPPPPVKTSKRKKKKKRRDLLSAKLLDSENDVDFYSAHFLDREHVNVCLLLFVVVFPFCKNQYRNNPHSCTLVNTRFFRWERLPTANIMSRCGRKKASHISHCRPILSKRNDSVSNQQQKLKYVLCVVCVIERRERELIF
jgi:hypothetical protein